MARKPAPVKPSPAVPADKLEWPKTGGSWIRQADGSLDRDPADLPPVEPVLKDA